VSFKFARDPTSEQARQMFIHAGAARFAFNHRIDRVKANLDQRAERKKTRNRASLNDVSRDDDL